MEVVCTIEAVHHGNGAVHFDWHSNGRILASCGPSRVVQIFTIKKNSTTATTVTTLADQVLLPAPRGCTQLAWHPSASVIAMTQEHSTVLVIYDAETKKHKKIELPAKENTISQVAWTTSNSSTTFEIVIATGRGNIYVYTINNNNSASNFNTDSEKAEWCCKFGSKPLVLGILISNDINSSSSVVAVASTGSDRQLWIYDHIRNKVLRQHKLKATVSSTIVVENTTNQCLAGSLDGGTLFLYKDDSNLEHVSFTEGEILALEWCGPSKLVVGFESGVILLIATATSTIEDTTNSDKEDEKKFIGQVLATVKPHRKEMTGFSFSPVTGLAATCDRESLCITNIETAMRSSDTSIVLQVSRDEFERDGYLHRIAWTDDGTLLTVTSTAGSLYSFGAAEAKRRRLPNSFTSVIIQPIPPLAFISSVIAVVFISTFVSMHVFSVSLVELMSLLSSHSAQTL